MKKFDLIKLININEEYKSKNLYINLHGIIIETNSDYSNVLFFNESNHGDFAIIKIENKDLSIEKEQLPSEYKNELLNKFKSKNLLNKVKLEPLEIKEFDIVELLVEDEKYTKFGIHKGDTGCVMENYAVQNYILVDFSRINANNEFYGDCISVNIKDLKKIK